MLVRGLGFDVYDLKAEAGFETCSNYDSACVMRNSQRNDQVNAIWATYMTNPAVANMPTPAISLNIVNSSQALQNFMNNIPSQVYAPVSVQPPPITPNTYTPSFSFTTNRSGTNFFVGDTWNITITGKPGAKVVVGGGIVTKGLATTPMGVIDNNGRFTASGTFDSSTVGTWLEQWQVDGVSVQALSFTVSPAPTTQVSQSSQTTGGNVNTGQQTVSTGTTNTNSTTQSNVFGLFGDSSPTLIDSIPIHEYTLLGIAGALVVGFMMMKGRR